MGRSISKSKPQAIPKFGDLPPDQRGQRVRRRKESAWAPVLRRLMKQPGAWALIGEATPGGVSAVKLAAKKLGVFETTTRTQTGSTRVQVWARYIGPVQPAVVVTPPVPDVTVAPWDGRDKTWSGTGEVGSFEKPLHGLTPREPVGLSPSPAWRPADASLA